MTDNISIIREAGFFKNYSHLNEKDLLDTLHEIRKERYSKLFGYAYEPEKKFDIYHIASQDSIKFLDIDLEADVGKDNNVYVSILEEFANASNGQFQPTDIEETWDSDSGPIKVSFKSNGKIIVFEPEYSDDWIDPRIFEVINDEMKKIGNELFHLCLGPYDEWAGQNAIHIRLTPSEKQILKEKLKWEFPAE